MAKTIFAVCSRACSEWRSVRTYLRTKSGTDNSELIQVRFHAFDLLFRVGQQFPDSIDVTMWRGVRISLLFFKYVFLKFA